MMTVAVVSLIWTTSRNLRVTTAKVALRGSSIERVLGLQGCRRLPITTRPAPVEDTHRSRKGSRPQEVTLASASVTPEQHEITTKSLSNSPQTVALQTPPKHTPPRQPYHHSVAPADSVPTYPLHAGSHRHTPFEPPSVSLSSGRIARRGRHSRGYGRIVRSRAIQVTEKTGWER